MVKINKLQEALEFFEKALNLDPEHSKAWHNKGIILELMGYKEKALEAYDNALKLNSYYNTWYLKGNVLVELGKNKEGLNCYNKTLQLKPDYNDAKKAKEEILSTIKQHNNYNYNG